jgi:hypothetical protein
VVAGAASLAVAAGLAYSVWIDVPHSWRLMRNEHAQFAGYTSTQRAEAFGTLLPLRMDIFEFWRRWLRPGDRYWIQIPNEAFSSNADKRLVVRSVAHLYLLPAIETRRLADADVVLSWDADPGLLHLRYSDQERAGLQLIFVSRIARGA